MNESAVPREIWMPDSPNFGCTNAILCARSRRHYVSQFCGPLSIKTVTEGRVAWKRAGRETWIDPSCILILNAGEPYSMNIDELKPVATSCVFFADGFVESLYADMTGDIQGACVRRPLELHSCLYPHSQPISAILSRLRLLAANPRTSLDLDENFLELGRELLVVNSEVRNQISRIPALGPATREELFRRVARGRDFLHAEFTKDVRLSETARAAGLSSYHFQRSFRKAFGISPSRYLKQLRMAKAAQLLRDGSTVTEACFAVGFSSLGSFSAAFRSKFGSAPSSFRYRN